jgi:hypothetical protein
MAPIQFLKKAGGCASHHQLKFNEKEKKTAPVGAVEKIVKLT